MNQFAGKVALVTGAGRGIGRAIALAFTAQGASVAANDITPVNLDETLEQIRAGGGIAKDYVFDIAKKMPVQTLLSEVLGDFGRIDILVNNAGVAPQAPLLELDEWDWQRALDVNLSGPFYLIQAVSKVMKQQGGGVIVNIAATAAGVHGLKDSAAFAASKMGLLGLTREAGCELAIHHIRVNAVCPGQIDTGKGWLVGNQSSPNRGRVDFPLPQEQIGRPDDVAEAVLFLCSEEAADINGQAFYVDGSPVIF
ncbi:MAG: SDR family oxidoreductase [Anaerolineales bacterium]|nr:SDR family oxidoreductase [Anaerolineales bacterium]